MRCLLRNQSTFWYALYQGKKPLQDEYGNDTSEYEVMYANPVKCRANISAARGETATRQFGDDVGYDKVMVVDAPQCPIDEYTVLWVDHMPVLDEDGTTQTPWDYEVRKAARSLNSVTYAIRKVDVSV